MPSDRVVWELKGAGSNQEHHKLFIDGAYVGSVFRYSYPHPDLVHWVSAEYTGYEVYHADTVEDAKAALVAAVVIGMSIK